MKNTKKKLVFTIYGIAFLGSLPGNYDYSILEIEDDLKKIFKKDVIVCLVSSNLPSSDYTIMITCNLLFFTKKKEVKAIFLKYLSERVSKDKIYLDF